MFIGHNGYRRLRGSDQGQFASCLQPRDLANRPASSKGDFFVGSRQIHVMSLCGPAAAGASRRAPACGGTWWHLQDAPLTRAATLSNFHCTRPFAIRLLMLEITCIL